MSLRAKPVGLILIVAVVLAGVGLVGVDTVMRPTLVAGPMVQQTDEGGFTIVWQADQPTEGEVMLLDPADGTVVGRFPAKIVGAQHRAVVSGLRAGQRIRYSVRQRSRLLDIWRPLGKASTTTTAKPPGEPFRMVVVGDSGTGQQTPRRVVEQIIAQKPDLVLHTGDLVCPSGAADLFADRFWQPYGPLVAQVCFWPVLGNHDCEAANGRAFLQTFALPDNGPPGLETGRSYWFQTGNALIVAVDSTYQPAGNQAPRERVLSETIAPWLADVLAHSQARWRFVFFHHPPYTGCSHHPPDQAMQRAIVPVLQRGGVHVAFAGHDHLYERSRPLLDGRVVAPGTVGSVVYVTTAAGGQPLYNMLPPERRPPYVAAFNDLEFSFTRLDVSDEAIRLTQLDWRGRVLDEHTLEYWGTGQEADIKSTR